MIITWGSEYIGHVGFTANPEDYDAEPPIRSLWFDAGPVAMNADREAVALALTFGRYASGRFQVVHKFSPVVAHAIEASMQPVWTTPSPIEYYPKALPIGSRTLDVHWTDEPAPSLNLGNEAQLAIQRSDRSAGSMRGLNRMTLSSNAWLHADTRGSELVQIFPLIAVAVLFAEDLNADVLRIRGQFDESSDEWINLVRLLATARLGITQVPA
ncbi:hypothetical protein BKD30_08145 [Tersicoccus phoenicis]|uniref:Uncharacterized protein n=1 Tax=Tersicoccus phoenicis TaxID=554083 RepID=A0A1R1LAK2_9MICC|nr:hypothetical protein [Tersicoccus phoenicis]OMH24539.1 hypothetical protein BKD30_08145 [Tersicoccus phoenicis]